MPVLELQLLRQGELAQVVERLLSMQEAVGSMPTFSIQSLSVSRVSCFIMLIYNFKTHALSFAQPICMCFVYFEKAFNRVPWGVLWKEYEYGVSGPRMQCVPSLYDRCQSLLAVSRTRF